MHLSTGSRCSYLTTDNMWSHFHLLHRMRVAEIYTHWSLLMGYLGSQNRKAFP